MTDPHQALTAGSPALAPLLVGLSVAASGALLDRVGRTRLSHLLRSAG